MRSDRKPVREDTKESVIENHWALITIDYDGTMITEELFPSDP